MLKNIKMTADLVNVLSGFIDDGDGTRFFWFFSDAWHGRLSGLAGGFWWGCLRGCFCYFVKDKK